MSDFQFCSQLPDQTDCTAATHHRMCKDRKYLKFPLQWRGMHTWVHLLCLCLSFQKKFVRFWCSSTALPWHLWWGKQPVPEKHEVCFFPSFGQQYSWSHLQWLEDHLMAVIKLMTKDDLAVSFRCRGLPFLDDKNNAHFKTRFNLPACYPEIEVSRTRV